MITLVAGAVATASAMAIFGMSRSGPVVLAVQPEGRAPGSSAWPDTVTVDLRRTDTVVIRNQDDDPFYFGGAVIAPGQSLVQRFEEPGVYILQCGAHSAGTLRFVVLGDDGTISGRPPASDANRASSP